MILSLFNSFDFLLILSKILLTISFLIILILLTKLIINFWSIVNLIKLIRILIIVAFKRLITEARNKFLGANLLMKKCFFLILFVNLVGISPFIFSLSARLEISLRMGLSYWVIIIMKRLEIRNNKIFISLVPKDITINISRFLSLIESIRNIIRPLTVSFRLRANVTAGHIIFGIFGSGVLYMLWSLLFNFLTWLSFFCYFRYIIFEFCIILVQAFVFILLFFLYQNEYY